MRMFVILSMLAGALVAWGEPYLTEPAVCPTRPEIAFVSGGDIWMVSAKGGEAHLLVSHPADESRPLYSPDGSQLAFDDGLDQLDGWSRDGRWLYFSSGSHDVNRKNDIYRVSAQGGTPMAVS